MDLVKTVLIVIAALVGLAILYAYIKHLFEEGYDEEEIYLHIFRDVPLRFLKRNKQNTSDYSGYASRKKVRRSTRQWTMTAIRVTTAAITILKLLRS